MKIGIITIHYGINFGSALQTYALSNCILDMFDAQVEVINYIPKRYTKMERYFFSEIENNFFISLIKIFGKFPNKVFQEYIFSRFYKKNINLGKKLYNIKQLEKYYRNYDVLITGSDQVWNSYYNCGVDSAYFLSFGNDKQRKIAFAASAGNNTFLKDELKVIKKYLTKIDAISIRESSLLDTFQKMGFNKSIHVLDPIFLLSKERWRNKIGERLIKDEYVLIYALDRQETCAIKYAKYIADILNCKIAIVSYGHLWTTYDGVDYQLKHKSPIEFVNYLYYSRFVITNSFHGISFSINLNKQFLSIERLKFNTRLNDLLEYFDVKDRQITINFDDNIVKVNNIVKKDVNYSDINLKLESSRDISKGFLYEYIQ